MIEVKSEGDSWNNLGKVGMKEEGEVSRERAEPVEGLSSSASGIYSAAGLCLSTPEQSEGPCKIETKASMSSGMIGFRSPQPSHAELLLSSLNQRTSEKAFSYFQQKIPTWRVSTLL